MSDAKPKQEADELDLESGDPSKLDGRVARRERNRDAVLDVVLEMFADDMMFPTIEQASQRSGLSLRSVYRYFADPGELLDAAIKRNRESVVQVVQLPHVGEGLLATRIDDFVTMRVRLHGQIGAVYRATTHNAPRHQRVSEELARSRQETREQFELQFATELKSVKASERDAILNAGDLLTQLDSIDILRRSRGLSVKHTEDALRVGLHALLS